MDVLLTSFGHGMREDGRAAHFRRMAPLMFGHSTGRFHFDYAPVFLFDRMIIDTATYESAQRLAIDIDEELPHPIKVAVRRTMSECAAALKTLSQSGRLVITDYSDVLLRQGSLISELTNNDLRDPEHWAKPILKSIQEWSSAVDGGAWRRIADMSDFLASGKQRWDPGLALQAHSLSNEVCCAEIVLSTLRQWRKRQPPERREYCRGLLGDYLTYANSNLVLSAALHVPFIDWKDMEPIYAHKFARAVEASTMRNEHTYLERGRNLFQVLFPYFSPRSPEDLVRLVEDRRLDELRTLVRDAAESGREIDSEWAIELLKDLLRAKDVIAFRRRITGWLTLPLGAIPLYGTPLKIAVQQLADKVWSDRPARKQRWFYLISEIDSTNRSLQHGRAEQQGGGYSPPAARSSKPTP